MKTIIHSSILLALASSGIAFGAATATTTPVGYETLAVSSGFNYLGLRLQQPTVIAGTFETVGTSSLTDTGATFSLAASETYIIEIDDGSGLLTEVLGSAAVGDTIATIDNLSAAGVANGAKYKIRKAATLASVFGATNSAGLVGGFGSIAGADVIFVPDGSGGFTQYYYDDADSSWADLSGLVPSTRPLIYTETLIISANASLSLNVNGEVKAQPTKIAVDPGFNYICSVYPAGATLSSTFDGAIPQLTTGFGSIAGADVFFVPDGSGGFTQYYYDDADSSWAGLSGVVTGSSVNLPSGVVFSNEGAAFNLDLDPPAFYSSF